MRIYPDQSYRLIREAEDALKKIKSASGTDSVKRSFSTFLGSTRSIFFPIHNMDEIKDLPSFKEWWKSKQDSLDNNKLSKFFYNLRNENLKSGIDILTVSFMIKGPSIIGSRSPDSVIQIGPEFGINEIPEKKLSKTFPREDIFNTNITAITFNLNKCSNKFIRKFAIFQNADAISLSEKYLDYLKNIIDEYTDMFGRLN